MRTAMNSPKDLKSLLKLHEGLKLKPYLDTRGYLSIGYGRCLDTRGLSADEAEYLLDNDIKDFTDKVHGLLPWTLGLDEVRHAVVVNLAYNLGMAGLLTFQKMLAALEAGQWDTAAEELLDSAYHQQVGGRAVQLARMLKEGTWL
jgi:lysozyme